MHEILDLFLGDLLGDVVTGDTGIVEVSGGPL